MTKTNHQTRSNAPVVDNAYNRLIAELTEAGMRPFYCRDQNALHCMGIERFNIWEGALAPKQRRWVEARAERSTTLNRVYLNLG